MAIPFLDLKAQHRALKSELMEAASRVLDSCAFASGPEVAAFEEDFAAYCNVKYAAGVNTGTSALHRAALKSEAAATTALTNLFTGRPARGIVNRVMRELGCLHPGAPQFPLATAAIVPLRAQAEQRGLTDFTPLWAGQNASGCREISAAQLTRQLASQLPPLR